MVQIDIFFMLIGADEYCRTALVVSQYRHALQALKVYLDCLMIRDVSGFFSYFI